MINRRTFFRIGAVGTLSALHGALTERKSLAEAAFPPMEVPPGYAISIRHQSNGIVTGLPLIWAQNAALLLGRDGQLHLLDPAGFENPAVAGPFRPYELDELRSQLNQEFSSGYEIRTTANTLIVQPRGSGNAWPEAMDTFFREFQRELTLRNVRLREAHFPMVSVVYPDEASFARALATQGQSPGTMPLGLYSAFTNRVILIDHGRSSGGVASTIRHEAAHQVAFNQGIHIRLADNPSWFVEGLGAFFETTNGNGAARNADAQSRTNWWRQIYGQFVPTAEVLTQSLERLLERDDLFQEHSDLAYSVSWALTSYLFDRMPQSYNALIERFTQLSPLQSYAKPRRRHDTFAALSVELPLLAQNIHRWINQP